MIWMRIFGFSKYEVSENGKIRRALDDKFRPKSFLRRGQKVKMRKSKFGYLRCELLSDEGKYYSMTAHRAIALGFLGPPPFEGAWALHSDDNPSHNNLKNIRWGTPQENADDRQRNGGTKYGKEVGHAKLTESKVREIKMKYKGKRKHPTLKELGLEYGVSLHAIRHVLIGKTWRHIQR